MNRIPKDLDLTPLYGLEVIQVAIGHNELILQFHPTGSITLEGAWTLKDKEGRLVDQAMEHSQRDAWQIHRVIGRKISKIVIKDEKHLDVYFEDFVLEIEDDSDHYETFSIEHPTLKLYV